MNTIKAVVLAAGKGTRLQTEGVSLPKVLRQACQKPLLHYVLEATSFIPPEDTILVVGYEMDQVLEAFPSYPYAEQKEQLGTGHAVMAARHLLTGEDCPVLVCYGDMPLLRQETYADLIASHLAGGGICTVLSGTTHLDLPYGRIVRDQDGVFVEVVEDRDCTAAQKAIQELNVGVYVFSSHALLGALGQLKTANSQGEYYLTDVPAILKAQGCSIDICKVDLGDELIGVNTVEQLVQVEASLQARGLR